MAPILLVGGTGLVGSNILSTLSTLPSISSIYTLARRQPKFTDSKLQPIVESDSSKWAYKVSAIQPAPSIFFSALGTTRAAAGGLENQRKIDYDLNLELAQAAKAAGVRVYVLISSAGASSTTSLAYTKMKGELEDAVKALDFETTVIVKPGIIIGARENSGLPESILRGVAKFAGAISGGLLKDSWAQDADVIGRAAVRAGMQALAEEGPKVRELDQSEIVKLGKTE